jgi:WD40 repeat protein
VCAASATVSRARCRVTAEPPPNVDATFTHLAEPIVSMSSVATVRPEVHVMSTRVRRFIIAVLPMGLAGALTAGADQSAREVFERARLLEAANPESTEVLKLYGQAVALAKNDRPLTAQALLGLGRAQERAGQYEARATYARIMKEYAEQAGAAQFARERLAALETAVASKRLVWTVPAAASPVETVTVMNVSPNGRYVLCMPGGMDLSGGLMTFVSGRVLLVTDLETGTRRRLTQPTPGEGVGSVGPNAAWSRDSRYVAYAFQTGGRSQLRVVERVADGLGSDRVLFDNPDIKEVRAYDWTPDGKTIAVTVARADGTRQIGLISGRDGALTSLKTIGWRSADGLVFSPDGRFLAAGVPDSDSNKRHISILATDGTREAPGVRSPIDDSPLGWSAGGDELFFVRRRGDSDQLWAVAVAAKESPREPRFVRELGPLNERANLTPSGALFTYENPRTASVRLTATLDMTRGAVTSNVTGAERLFGTTASEDILGFAFSPDGRFVAYRHRVRRSAEVVTVRNIATGLAREFPVNFQMNYQRLAWTPDSRALVVGGTNFDGRGHGIFRIDAESGAASPIVVTTSADALTSYGDDGHATSADSSKFYYQRVFEGGGKGRVLLERNLATGEDRQLMPQGAWVLKLSHDKRKVYFYDISVKDSVLTERDLETGREREFVRGVTGDIGLSPNGRFLVAMVRTAASPDAAVPAGPGRTLTVFDLSGKADLNPMLREFNAVLAWAPDSQSVIAAKGAGQLWWVPLDGRAPRRLTELDGAADDRTVLQALHPDGQSIVIGRTSLKPLPPVEVWRLDNFLRKPDAGR